ncbi:hypothetical protein LCGC14_0337760 [marine sediment metagenome]|uniref:Uncharacterized protein n=1 Tax=marine sediment metagenome TaxID=412755 RepID=A0A0F9TX94_9ZZZZ
MTDTEQVQTDTGTEDSPPETPDSAPPEDTGQEAATPEGEVGAEVVEEEKLTPFHEHPDWIAREEKLKEQELATVRADARAEAFQQQLQQAQAAPKEQPKTHAPEEVRRMHEEGEITDTVYQEYLAEVKATEKSDAREMQRLQRESFQRAKQLAPDMANPNTVDGQLFAALTDDLAGPYTSLFNAQGQPLVYNAFELVARDIKSQRATQTTADTARLSEEQRLRAVEAQATNNEAPHGRGTEEEMGDATKQLDDRQAAYMAKRLGRPPTDKEAREYLDHDAALKTVSGTPWPEKARR